MQLWMIPFFFVCIFLYQNLLRKLRGTNSAAVENLLDFGSDGEEEDDDDVSGNGASTTSGSTRKKDSSKTGLRDRIKAIEKITQNIQNILGSVASFGERVKK